MVVAVIAGLVALVLVTVVIVLIFSYLNGRKTSNISVKKNVNSIGSVGVSSSLSQDAQCVAGSGASRAGVTQQSAPSPAGNLKSRLQALGILAAGIFGTLTVKLWAMQILEGSSYSSSADSNQYTTIYTSAPRGYIYDTDGIAMVTNRSSLTVLAEADVADDHDVMQRLSATLGVPYAIISKRIEDATSGAQSDRVVASDVRMRDIAFIAEHSDAFPGVTIETRTAREYPYEALASHALGYTGTVTDSDLESVSDGRHLESDDDVGRSGIELKYDNLLAGDHGQRKVVADTYGDVVEIVSETQPVKGSDIHLTISAPIQYVCDTALADLIAPEDGVIGTGTGTSGAAVVMDVTDGSILAMASYPTYSPRVFVGGISQASWDLYSSTDSYYPLYNRVIAGNYPAASTYKPFTGMAALNYGFADYECTWDCTGSWDGWNTGSPQSCWNDAGHGELDFRSGIVQSCDVVFYDIAYNFWEDKDEIGETALQEYLSKYRFGETTGIDLGGEDAGRLPTPEWKASYYSDYPEEGVWQGGDMTNMIIGQGYVLVTPLQMAVTYGGIATGKLMKPHLLKEVRNSVGDIALSYEPEVVSEPDVDLDDLELVRDALNGVATENASISALFEGYDIDPATIACKTGTGEVIGKGDFAWFVCYAPYDDPKYVVACVVEEGGGGSSTGAPLGAEIMAAVLEYDAGNLTSVGVVPGCPGTSIEYDSTTSGRTD